MFMGDDVCLSPNINYSWIDLLPLNGNKIEIEKERTNTLEVLKDIEKSQGEFDLY